MSVERFNEDGKLIQYRGLADSPDCHRCPCARQGRPPKAIQGAGAVGGLCVIGEGPSTEEMFQGWPFVGPSGKELNKVFARGGIDRHASYITNALLCPRPKDDAAFAVAVECCRPRLQAELELIQPTAISVLGGTAARALQLPVTTIGDSRGTVQHTPLLPGIPVVVTIHPAALFKGGAGEVSGGKQKANVDAQAIFLQFDVEKAHRIATGTLSPKWSDDIGLVHAGACTPEQIDAEMRKILDEACGWGLLGLDLEWDERREITWLGLGTDKRSVSFWFPDVVPLDALDMVREAMADSTLPKLIHNVQADKGTWEGHDVLLDSVSGLWNTRVGPMRGVLEDTMLMHHAAYPGIAHDLQNVASQFLPVPAWKTLRVREVDAAKKKLAAEIKAAAKAEKQREKEVKAQQAAAERAAVKAEKEKAKVDAKAEHEARNAALKAEKEQRKAKAKAEHEARNATSAAEAEERRRSRKRTAATTGTPVAPPPSGAPAESGVEQRPIPETYVAGVSLPASPSETPPQLVLPLPPAAVFQADTNEATSGSVLPQFVPQTSCRDCPDSLKEHVGPFKEGATGVFFLAGCTKCDCKAIIPVEAPSFRVMTVTLEGGFENVRTGS